MSMNVIILEELFFLCGKPCFDYSSSPPQNTAQCKTVHESLKSHPPVDYRSDKSFGCEKPQSSKQTAGVEKERDM